MKLQKSFILSFLALLSCSLLAEESEHPPLYAGTLLAFYPENADPGKVSVQPYLFVTRKYGNYSRYWKEIKQKHTDETTLLLSLETGITHFLDVTLELAETYSHYNKRGAWGYNDTTVYFGFQLSRDQKKSWIPDSRLILGETFPTGKYKRLDAHKKGSDIFGAGSYATTFLFIAGKTYYWLKNHPINLNLNFYYTVLTSVSIDSPSVYGGSFHTKGNVHPGAIFITNFAIQYTINTGLVLGADVHYVHQNKTPFSGKKDPQYPVGAPSSEQFSIAPCIEYSWNENFSLSGGSWFSVGGRNASNFTGLVGTVFYYF